MNEELIRNIEYELLHWNDPDSAARKRFESLQEKYDSILLPLQEAIENAERLTADDFTIQFYPLPE